MDDPRDIRYSRSIVVASVPSFYLYGEPHRAVADGFVHAELLDDRSRPSEWTILPHAHADLVQIFLVERGGGTIQAEAQVTAIAPPMLLIIPAGVVHGFDWHQDSAGAVVTLGVRHLELLGTRYAGLIDIFATPRAIALEAMAAAAIRRGLDTLMRELGWAAPGHRAAVDAALLSVLVEALRATGMPDGGAPQSPGPHHALVAGFRARIDERFRLREPIAVHAKALGSSESRLRVACARVAALSPAAMLDDRAMLEARRALLYTNLSVAEVGYAIGMADPAYFSRFFTRHEGCSPRDFRARRLRGTDASAAPRRR